MLAEDLRLLLSEIYERYRVSFIKLRLQASSQSRHHYAAAISPKHTANQILQWMLKLDAGAPLSIIWICFSLMLIDDYYAHAISSWELSQLWGYIVVPLRYEPRAPGIHLARIIINSRHRVTQPLFRSGNDVTLIVYHQASLKPSLVYHQCRYCRYQRYVPELRPLV